MNLISGENSGSNSRVRFPCGHSNSLVPKLMDLMEYLEGLTSSKSGIFWVQSVKDEMLKCDETSTETILRECMNTW